MNIVAILMLTLSVIFTAIVLITAVIGCFRGWKKSTFALCRTLAAALSSTLVLSIWHRITNTGGLLTTILSTLSATNIIGESEANMGASMLTFLKNFVSALTVPFDFSILFVVFALIWLIPGHFIGKRLGIYLPKSEQKPKLLWWERLIGALSSAVCCLFVISILIAPYTNIVDTVTAPLEKIVSIADEEGVSDAIQVSDISFMEGSLTDEDISEIKRLTNEYLSPVTKNVYYVLSVSLPIRANFALITNTADPTWGARNELKQLLEISADLLYFAEDPENYGEKQSDALYRITDYFIVSKRRASFLSDVISVSVTVDIGQEEKDERSRMVIAELQDITPKEVQADLRTLRDIGILLIDNGAVVAGANMDEDGGEAFRAIISDEDLLYTMLEKSYVNEHTRLFLGYALSSLFSSITEGSIDASVYKSEITDGLSESDLRAEATLFSQILFLDLDMIAADAPASNSDLGTLIDLGLQSKLLSANTKVLVSVILDDLDPELSAILQKHIDAGDISFADMLTVTGELEKIATLYSNSGETDLTALAASLSTLKNTLDENSAALMQECMKTSAVQRMFGLSENTVATSALSGMIQALNEGNYTEEDLYVEAKAIDYAMQFARAESFEDIKTLCDTKEKQMELVSTLSSSEIASEAIVFAMYDDGTVDGELTEIAQSIRAGVSDTDVRDIEDVCKSYYIEAINNGADQFTTETNVRAIAAVLGCDISDLQFEEWIKEAK